MSNLYIGFGLGFFGSLFFDILIVNFIYLGNVALFNDLILSKKNSEKLKKFYCESGGKNEKN